MRNFSVIVNGVSYEVSVEELGANQVQQTPTQNIVNTPAPVAAPVAAPVSKPAEVKVVDGEAVVCPMPGTILDIKFATGSTVKSGDVVVILEAMKMENEIVAPCDGKIAQISVNKGASVNAGEPLFVIS